MLFQWTIEHGPEYGCARCVRVHWKLRWLVGVESMSDGAMVMGPWLDLECEHSVFCVTFLPTSRRWASSCLYGTRRGADIRSWHQWAIITSVAWCPGLQGPPDVFNLEDISPCDTAHLITQDTGQAELSWAQNTAWANSFHILNFTLIGSRRLVTIHFSLSIYCINLHSIKRRFHVQATKTFLALKFNSFISLAPPCYLYIFCVLDIVKYKY